MELSQLTCNVISDLEPSLKVPIAVYCWVWPLGRFSAAGVTAIETRTAALALSIVDPVTPETVALIMLLPGNPVTVANPPGEVMVATPGVPESQLATLVRSCVVLSVKVPVAVNWTVSPFGTLGVGGVTLIELKVADDTAILNAGLVIEPKAAVMPVVPELATAVTSPPATVAIVLSPVFQVAVEDRSLVWPSVNRPVAVSCSLLPLASVADGPFTVREVSTAAVTVKFVEEATEPWVAMTMTVPVLKLLICPWLPEALLTLAMVLSDEDQVTELVRSCVPLSLNVPVAFSC